MAGLERFVEAQDERDMYGKAIAELRDGEKRRHWMWFVFPQIAGLGHSQAARYYAIRSLDEAREYLEHPVLGPRLAECTRILAGTEGRSAVEILGPIDAMKLRSSMTLFARAAPQEPLFQAVLDRYYDGEPDPATLRLLGPG